MSYREQFIAAWVTQQQRAFHQSTRGIMTPEDRQILEDEAEKAMAEVERDAALAAVERVRVIHARDEHGLCVECSWEYPETSYDALSNDVSWPCPTVAALDGEPEPEGRWEYGLLNPQAPDRGKLRDGAHLISDNREHILKQQRRGHPSIQAVRRRKAGPWLPVEGEKP